MDISKNISNSFVIFIIVIVCLIFTVNINLVDITIMEARNFVTAREMLLENNWLMPTFNGEPRYQKPPLPTWISAISTLIAGTKTLYFFRIPGFLCLALIGITTYYFSLELLKNKIYSIVNSFIAITSFYTIAIIIEAPWDIFSHSFMYLAIYFIYKNLNNQKYYFKEILLIILLVSCSFLSKGPVSVYALLIPFLISYFISYPISIGKKLARILPIIIAGILIGSSWYIMLLFQDSENLISTTRKETLNWTNYNIRPFYYYWSFFIQSGVWAIIGLISLSYPYYKHKIKSYKEYKFTFLWTVIGVILLSLIPEKKPRYLMPVLIPFALNIGFIYRYLISEYNKNKSAKIFLFVHYLLICSIGLSFIIVKLYIFNLSINFIDIILSILSPLILLKLINIKFLTIKKINIISLLIIILSISNSPTLILKTNKDYNSVKNLNSDELEFYTNYLISPEIIWDFGKKITRLNDLELRKITQNRKKFGMLTKDPITTKDTLINKLNYTIELISKHDLNSTSKKSRLITYYHLFTPN